MRTPQHDEHGPPLQDLILSVFQLSNVLTASGDRLVADLGLTSARWQVLGAVTLGPPQSVASLARDLEVSRQNVQRIVNDLVRDGFVTFESNPKHRRAQLVVMTTQGAGVMAAAATRARPWAEHAGAALTPGDIDTARRVLHAIGAAVQGYDHHEPHEESA
ncbi:MarR family winged helix-turn-helix transcriptional regulator [Agrococcus versicolor]|uniref:MarR family winged helix-turn-helix transcriptional regulator n=1 Tax=Agrococcus versicolor TaxID=501482 RepID=UPI0031D05850